jgi:hypothetical protein
MSMENTIPAEVIAEDRRLDGQAKSAQEDLARLRWHWTLDPSNTGRVSFEEYGRQAGVAGKYVSVMANGYAAHLDTPERGGHADIGMTPNLTDQIELAKVGETKRKAAQLIADNNGIRVSNVLSNRRSEVAALIDTAQDAAARRGTTVDAELERAAETRRKVADVRAKSADEAKARKDLRYIEIEGDVAAAMRHMNHVLELARTVALTDEHIELITDSIANLRALLGLIDMQLTGSVSVDWDTELRKIGLGA